MIVTSATETTATPSSTKASTPLSKKDAMGKDQFLKLLVEQLKHQDPLSPMQNTEFTAQMAQFSSLEQLYNVNTNLGSLSQINTSVASAQSMGMIGKEVKAAGNGVEIKNGQATNLSFHIPSDAGTVNIHITNGAGEVVSTINQGGLSEGDHTIPWDGKDLGGGKLPDGSYTYSIDARSVTGQAIDPTTFMRGIVKSVTIENGNTYLNVGNVKVAIGDVMEVSQPAAGASANKGGNLI
ncbi:MAG: flagellar hook assembly protein FlgD [Nitrospinae bacterium]|nr:flagellar hook assembly protein FlgD [Nitrospinota bacterium]